MLVLSRKKNQSIYIGDDIEIKVLSFEEERILDENNKPIAVSYDKVISTVNHVRLGIKAPPNIKIDRKKDN